MVTNLLLSVDIMFDWVGDNTIEIKIVENGNVVHTRKMRVLVQEGNAYRRAMYKVLEEYVNKHLFKKLKGE